MVPDTCPLLTLLPNELQTSVRGQIGLEFCKESSGHGLRHLTCVLHRSNMWFTHAWVTFVPFELQTSTQNTEAESKQRKLSKKHVKTKAKWTGGTPSRRGAVADFKGCSRIEVIVLFFKPVRIVERQLSNVDFQG